MSTKWCMHEPNSYKKATHCHWTIVSIQMKDGKRKGKGQFRTIWYFFVCFFWVSQKSHQSISNVHNSLLNLWFYLFNCILGKFLKTIASNQSKHMHSWYICNFFVVKNDNRFMKANRVAKIKCQRMFQNGNSSNVIKSFDRPDNKPKFSLSIIIDMWKTSKWN